jgi:hypothetical protein
MRMHDPANYRDPLDVLRRFVPTSHRARYRIRPIQVVVETNDFTLLPGLPLDEAEAERADGAFEWKLIRDSEALGPLAEPVFLTSGNLTMVYMGTACLLGLDHKRRELLGFIGLEVDPATFQEYLLPILCRMSTEALGEQLLPSIASAAERRADA